MSSCQTCPMAPLDLYAVSMAYDVIKWAASHGHARRCWTFQGDQNLFFWAGYQPAFGSYTLKKGKNTQWLLILLIPKSTHCRRDISQLAPDFVSHEEAIGSEQTTRAARKGFSMRITDCSWVPVYTLVYSERTSDSQQYTSWSWFRVEGRK